MRLFRKKTRYPANFYSTTSFPRPTERMQNMVSLEFRVQYFDTNLKPVPYNSVKEFLKLLASFALGTIVGASIFVLAGVFSEKLKPLCRGRVDIEEPAALANPLPQMSILDIKSKNFCKRLLFINF